MSLAKMFSTAAVAFAFALTPAMAEEVARDENAEKQAFLETLEKEGYAEVGAYKVEKIKDNIYHMDEGIKALPGGATDADGNRNNPSSIYFVVEDNEILIVDGGNRPDDGSEKEADARIIVEAMTGDRQITYAYSHGHVDHVGLTWNPAVFANIKDQFKVLYMHEADYVDSENSEKYKDNMLFGVAGTEAYKDKLEFVDTGDTFTVGDFTYEVLAMPGHTDGSVAYIQKNKELVFTGDAMGSGFVWLLWDSIENPIGRMVDAIKQLQPIVGDMVNPTILCGHRWQQFYEGNPQRPEEMSIQYLNDMVAVAQGLQNGSSLIEPYAVRAGAVEVSANDRKAKIDTTPEIIEMYLKESGINGWIEREGKFYWYEDGVRQGTVDDEKCFSYDGTVRGREIYDPESDAWYWLDADADGARATSKDVWMPYIFSDEPIGSTGGKWVYYDENGHMVKGFRRDGDTFWAYDQKTGARLDKVFANSGNDYSYNYYWYENGVRQGTVNDPNGVEGDGTIRGREIYDPATDAWYWLDANAMGKPAKNKQVWIPYIFQDEEPGSTEGKWVRYDADGHMIKGWYRNDEGVYYYDLKTGAMYKGHKNIDGKEYHFDETTGIALGNIEVDVAMDTIPTAYVTGGKIVGFTDGNGVKTFLNIPYGATTAGENRFKDPQPVEKWVGEKDCTTFGSIGLESLQDPFMCWSKEYVDWGLTFENGRMGEDMLNLNVWTKAEKGDKKAVIVYIHGGGNTSGSGQNEVYTGQKIVDKDVVYVTINYRYGLQGFLTYKDANGEEITGNFALKDMVKALEWVQENIEQFGGDPGNVTIAGQSAGSANVQKLLICPKAEGLFQHAVAMSANTYEGFGPMRGVDKADAQAEAAAALGDITVADLRNMSSEEIHKLRDAYNPSSFVIDGEWILDTQAGAYQSGKYNHVDFMTGCVQGDSVLFGGFLALPEGEKGWTPELYEQVAREVCGDKADAFLAAYPAQGDLDALVAQVGNDMANAQYSIALAAKGATDEDAKNYQWYFTRSVPDKDPMVEAMWGAFHTGDVGYWLNYFSSTSERPWTQTDYDLGEAMSSYIANFAKTGNPNGEGLPEWKDMDATDASVKYMILGEECKFEELAPEKAAFWTSFYAQ